MTCVGSQRHSKKKKKKKKKPGKQISTLPTDTPQNTYERTFILLSAEAHKVAT